MAYDEANPVTAGIAEKSGQWEGVTSASTVIGEDQSGLFGHLSPRDEPKKRAFEALGLDPPPHCMVKARASSNVGAR